MKTIIYTFTGGDTYNKKKQLNTIQLSEKESEIREVADLDSLDESLKTLTTEKVIILRESSNTIKFENIVKSEYPHLAENLEVIPELFFRSLREADQTAQNTQPVAPTPQNNGQRMAVSFVPDGSQELQPVSHLILPFSLPIPKQLGSNAWRQGERYLIIADNASGLWFPHLTMLLKFIPEINTQIFKAGTENIPQMSLEKFKEKYKNATYIISELEKSAQSGKNSYALCQQIYRDVKSKTVKLNQELIDKAVKDNKRINDIIAGIIANFKAVDSFAADSVTSGKDRANMEQSLGSQIYQMLGADRDTQTAVEGLNKAGFQLVTDAAKFIIDKSKKEKENEDKERSKGNEAQAFLSHEKCEDLLKLIFNGYGPNYFVEEENNNA